MVKKVHHLLRYAGKPARFARSIQVGDIVFCSGCSGQTLETFYVSSDNVEEQTRVALDKIRGALEDAGTSMNYIVKTVTFLKNMEDYPVVEEVVWEYYREHAPSLIDEPPCDTLIGVATLHEPDMLVEIEATAIMPD